MATILLVENEAILLGNLRHVLEQCGYMVLSAHSGEAAIRICHQYAGAIDVLVSDVVLDGINGFEVGAIVRSAHPKAIVILMSGSPADAFSHPFIANDFLLKPFDFGELLASISRHVEPSIKIGNAAKSWN